LIGDIVAFTGESGREPLYRKFIKDLGEQHVRVVLAESKDVPNPNNRGAVFTAKMKAKADMLGIDLGLQTGRNGTPALGASESSRSRATRRRASDPERPSSREESRKTLKELEPFFAGIGKPMPASTKEGS